MSDGSEERQSISSFSVKEISAVVLTVDNLPDPHILDRVNNDNIDVLIRTGVTKLRNVRKRSLQPLGTDITKLVDRIEGALSSTHALQCIVNDEEDLLAFQRAVNLSRNSSKNPSNEDQQKVVTFIDEHLEDLYSSESLFTFEIKRRLSLHTNQLDVGGDIEHLRTQILPWWAVRIEYYRTKYADRLDQTDDLQRTFKMVLDYCENKVGMLQKAPQSLYLDDQYYEICRGLSLIPFFITEYFEKDTLRHSPEFFEDGK